MNLLLALVFSLVQPPIPMPQPTPPPPLAPGVVVEAQVNGKVGEQIALVAKSSASVTWVSLTPGLNFVPRDKLNNSRETFVCAGAPGTYKYLVYAAVEKDKGSHAFGVVVVEGVTPGPGPAPIPPDPGPGPVPTPVTPGKRFILVVEETSQAAANRARIFADAALWARMKDKDHRWRIVDKDVIGADGKAPADVARFLAKIKSEGLPLPQVFFIDATGAAVGAPQQLPADSAALLELLKKSGG